MVFFAKEKNLNLNLQAKMNENFQSTTTFFNCEKKIKTFGFCQFAVILLPSTSGDFS